MTHRRLPLTRTDGRTARETYAALFLGRTNENERRKPRAPDRRMVAHRMSRRGTLGGTTVAGREAGGGARR